VHDRKAAGDGGLAASAAHCRGLTGHDPGRLAEAATLTSRVELTRIVIEQAGIITSGGSCPPMRLPAISRRVQPASFP
jgi:hypothetical protein